MVNPDRKNSKSDNFKKEWKTVDSLDNLGLPESALKIVSEIYQKAKEENNSDQYVKALIFKMKLTNQVKEDIFPDLILEVEQEIEVSYSPVKEILHSILAEMYWMYYSNNRWKFAQRTSVVGMKNEDIRTWTLDKLADKAIKHYMASVSEVQGLSSVSSRDFPESINSFPDDSLIRPTLYDFLAHRAIDFFSNTQISVTRPADKFMLKEDFYFADAENFAKQNITSSDTLSVQFYCVGILQELTKLHLSDNKSDALIHTELKRLKIVKQNSVNDLKDSLYLAALEHLYAKHSKDQGATEIAYEVADFYKNRAAKWNFEDPDTYLFKQDNENAVRYCDLAIKAFPENKGAKKCLYLKNTILQKSLRVSTEKFLPSSTNFIASVSYKNIERVWFKVLKMDREKYLNYKKSNYSYKLYDWILKTGEQVEEQAIELPVDNDHNEHACNIILNGKGIGYYIVIASSDPAFSYEKNYAVYSELIITDLAFMQRKLANGSYDFFVLDRKTGIPVPETKVETQISEYNYKSRSYEMKDGPVYYTDSMGYVNINSNVASNNSFYVDLRKGEDFLSTSSSYYIYNQVKEEKPVINTHLFTDRSLYRPGQTIWFKGIVIQSLGKKREIVSGHKSKVELYDVNYQKISEIELVSNDFGTYSGSFQIPTGLLNGYMTIRTETGNINVSVEEYKRPKFEVEALPVEGSYILNDSVHIKGKAIAYSGAPVTDAKTAYRIVRRPVWRGWRSWYRPYSETEISSGEITTNDDGIYNIAFKAVPDLSIPKSNFITFNYIVYIDVTDINGETRSTQHYLSVGYIGMTASVQLPDMIERSDKNEFDIQTRNLNGEWLNASGTISIKKLKSPEIPTRNRFGKKPDKFFYTYEEWNKKVPGEIYNDENDIKKFEVEKTVYEKSFNSEKTKTLILDNLKSWTPGSYVLEIKTKDSYGNPIENKKYFTVYSKDGKLLPYATNDWFNIMNPHGEPGEQVRLVFGSTNKIHGILEIEHDNHIVNKYFVDINNMQEFRDIPILESYRGNFSIHFSFISNNSFYSHSQVIIVPRTDKMLDIEFETFRSILQPGESDEWRIKIKGRKGEKVAAEMMATLYDASLDQFKLHNWYFSVFDYYYSSMNWGSNAFGSGYPVVLAKDCNENIPFPYEYFSTLNWFGFNYYGNYYYRREGTKNGKSHRSFNKAMAAPDFGNGEEMKQKAGEIVETADEVSAATTTVDGLVDQSAEAPNEDKSDAGQVSGAKIRTYFNETAFFYPQLKTDEDGNVIIKFTVPESLTRWKMLGLAHTKDLQSSIIENELITQKTLMISPNLPRFLRENDEMQIPVKITNLSEKELKGSAVIEFFDALTMKPVILTDGSGSLDFTVGSKKNSVVSWKIKVPDQIQAVVCRIVAKAENFSDGEENLLPVMSNRMLVTESMPLPVRGNTTKEFRFEKLINSGTSSTLKNEKLTLEFTSNPAWYAVQALPYLMEYPYDCIEQTFSRFYANSLGAHIANSSPRIKQVFDSWKKLPDSKALLSNLEKNQDLKSVLLEETPWVLNAQNETERKRNVALLFDLNKMSDQLEKSLQKIEKAQVSNGGWPWFEGMPDNRYITQHIVCGLGHLQKLGVISEEYQPRISEMTEKAVKYLDDRIAEDYDWLKKHYKKEELDNKHVSYLQIHYLYARSFYTDQQVHGKAKEAFEYYMQQAKKYWLGESKYMQGMIGLAAFRFGDKKIPAQIINSLKEHALHSEEMGMYWKSASGYYWHEAPIEMQSLLIELFTEVASDNASVDEMKVWLLKQKQTQDWKTTKATVEAVYALLLQGTNWLESTQLAEITIGDSKIKPEETDNVTIEPGTGYFKMNWNKNEIDPSQGKITVHNPNEVVAWGAVYWQYFEQLDKITPHETPLQISKKLFIERNTKSGKVIEPLTENALLKVGDKVIVRIELRVDRAMEYVHMKDMRASGFEPINVLSAYRYQDGLGYYESTKDAATNFFIGWMPKGTYVFEYPLRATHAGNFSNGITSIQCMYAPEFGSHSEGIKINIE